MKQSFHLAIAMALVLCLPFVSAVAGSSEELPQSSFDAVVVAGPDVELGPALQSLPRYGSVNGALLAGHLRIAITSGDYYEKVTIAQNGVSLTGVGSSLPRIFFDAYAGTAGVYHRDGWGTPGSATLTINAEGVSLDRLHIENSFDYLANDALPKDHPDKRRHSQAVALLLDVNSDRTYIRNSQIDGYQDTVFADGGRALFENSLISGNVDYIFGDGLAIFERCKIVTRQRGKLFASGSTAGHISAPSTNIKQVYGLVFIDSELTREEQVADHSVSLGRPWHPTTTFADGRYADPDAIGSAIYINTWMDAHIKPVGWASMGGTAKDGTKSLVFTPEDSRFFEYQSRGPGASTDPKRRQLIEADAKKVIQFVEAFKEKLGAL